MYGNVVEYTRFAVVRRRTVGVVLLLFVRGPFVPGHRRQPFVRAAAAAVSVIVACRHRGVRPERRAAHEHFELVELIVHERVFLLEFRQSRRRSHQIFVLIVHTVVVVVVTAVVVVVVVGRRRVIVIILGRRNAVVGRDRLVMMAWYTVDVDAFRNRVERHQRFEIGKIRRRFRAVVVVVVVRMVLRLVMMMLMMMVCRHVMTPVMAVMLVMVMVVVVVEMVMVVLLLVLLLVLMLVLRLRLHDDRRTVGGVLVAA